MARSLDGFFFHAQRMELNGVWKYCNEVSNDNRRGRKPKTTMSNSDTHNPHALDEAQSPDELFEIMNPPTANFDPYSDRPLSTNSFSTRAEAHQQGLWHCSVHIWIIKLPSSILLQKRSMNKDTFPGKNC
jgi:hypothetical protein